ncbi:MAG TPA: hypothetical protein VED59_01565 [Acidimicrobiales bacterium]|nr:hypothetical protein [Acidimicrobiales bacterium]
MSTSRVTPAELAVWRRQLAEEGDGEFVDPTLAQQIAPRLLAEVEHLQAELASARRDFVTEAAGALERRLREVAAFNRGGCPSCRDAEARAFLSKLQRIAEG